MYLSLVSTKYLMITLPLKYILLEVVKWAGVIYFYLTWREKKGSQATKYPKLSVSFKVFISSLPYPFLSLTISLLEQY